MCRNRHNIMQKDLFGYFYIFTYFLFSHLLCFPYFTEKTTIPKSGEIVKPKKSQLKSTSWKQKMPEPITGRNTYMLILMNWQSLRVKRFWQSSLSKIPTEPWVLPLEVLPSSCGEDQRKFYWCLFPQGEEGSIYFKILPEHSP